MSHSIIPLNRVLSEPKNRKVSYGCIFCVTGKERYIAEYMERCDPHIRARAVCQTKRFTSRGQTYTKNEVLLRGYVLFEAAEGLDIARALPRDDVIAVLRYADGEWRLLGADEDYARWVFRHDGLIGLSKAHQIGDHIHIIDGPLKDLEGKITRIDRRNRSGQVTICFGGKEIRVWLGFEIIEEQPVHERKLAAGQG